MVMSSLPSMVLKVIQSASSSSLTMWKPPLASTGISTVMPEKGATYSFWSAPSSMSGTLSPSSSWQAVTAAPVRSRAAVRIRKYLYFFMSFIRC